MTTGQNLRLFAMNIYFVGFDVAGLNPTIWGETNKLRCT